VVLGYLYSMVKHFQTQQGRDSWPDILLHDQLGQTMSSTISRHNGVGSPVSNNVFSYPWLPRSTFLPRVTKWSKFIDEFYGACGNPLTSSMQSFCRNCSRSSCCIYCYLYMMTYQFQAAK